MRRSTRSLDTGFVCMDRASTAGQPKFSGAGYRLAAGGLGRRWTPSGEDVEEPCLEDEFVAHTARAWTRMRGAAAQLPDAARAGVSAASGQMDRVNLAAVCQATALCAMAAIGASTALYWQKSRTAQVDHDIGHVVGEMANAHAQTGRLRAQWLALNDPARLQDAAARYSGLRPLAPAQFVDAGRLTDHLPAPGAVPADTGAETARATMLERGPERGPETVIAGDAMPIFKPVTAQAASMVVPALPRPPDAPVPVAPTQTNADIAAGRAEMASAPAPSPDTASPPPAPAHRPAPDAPKMTMPHPHAAAMRVAAGMARTPVRLAAPVVVHAASTAIRVAPPAIAHAELRPHVLPRMLMARFDMPHWLSETHAPPPPVIMSAPPHALGTPHDTSVLQPGRPGGEPALAVRPEQRATSAEADRSESQAQDDPPPAPLLRRPNYRPYYGYGYGYSGPYQPAQPRYYPNPYGGYSSQPYGVPYGTYYQ